MTDAVFSTYSPNGFQKFLINLSRNNDRKKQGKLIASIARRLTLLGHKNPFDVETFGVKMRLDPRRNVAEKRLMFAPSRFDIVEREILSQHLKNGDVFLDIGANIGGYSLWASKFIGNGKVLAFEPQPKVFARLKTNAELNPELNILPMQIAIGAEESEMQLGMNALNDGEGSLAKTNNSSEFIMVKVRPLLNVLNDEKVSSVSALKIDVEGFEETVLLPFFATSPKSFWPKLIILERGDGDWKADLKGHLLSIGYGLKQTTRMNYILEL